MVPQHCSHFYRKVSGINNYLFTINNIKYFTFGIQAIEQLGTGVKVSDSEAQVLNLCPSKITPSIKIPTNVTLASICNVLVQLFTRYKSFADTFVILKIIK